MTTRVRGISWRRVGLGGRAAHIAGAIVGSNVVTSGVGLVFWMLVGNELNAPALGLVGSATSAMALVGLVGMMGLGTLLISELPRTPLHERWELFAVGAATALAFGTALGAGFAAVAAATGTTWAPLAPFGALWWWFVLGCAMTALGGMLDQAMLVIGHPMMQVVRNAVASGWKVLVVLGFALWRTDVTVAMAAWTTGLLLGNALAIWTAARALGWHGRLRPAHALGAVRAHAVEAMRHQWVNLALAASTAVIPALVTWLLTAQDNGVFTAVRLATLPAFLLPYALAFSAFAGTPGEVDADRWEGSAERERMRRVLRFAFGVALALVAGYLVTAPLVLRLFGHEYATGSTYYLRLMVLACPLLVFKDQYIAEVRVRRSLESVRWFVVVGAIAEIGGAWVGAVLGGLDGMLLGWLAALFAQAVYVAPRLPWRSQPVPVRPARDYVPSSGGEV